MAMTLVSTKPCTVEGCDNAMRAKGLCPKHLRRLKVHGNTETVLPTRRKTPDGLCSVEGCDRKHRSNGYCDSHNKKFKRWGDPLYVYQVETKICRVDACEKKVDALGLCNYHEARFRRRGSAYGPFPRAKTQRVMTYEPTETTYTYRTIKNHSFLPDGRIAEHRYVMSEKLGRALLPHENVHHLNGQRDDNRVENLELWTIWQPAGQRVEDKIAYAKEILKTYSPESLRN